LVGVLGIAVAHAIELPGELDEVPYLGYLFILLIAGCVVLALLSRAMQPRRWWSLALAVAVVPFALFMVSRTVGLPGAHDDVGAWGEPTGIASLVFEAVTAVVAVRALEALTTAARVMAPPARRRRPARTTWPLTS
jgi:hypothetical protein